MPIEFACENCARVLRVPDGSSGKKSQCPACGQTQEIPYVIGASSQPGSAHHPSAGAARGGTAPGGRAEGGAATGHSAGLTADGKLSIPCPKCKHHLVCAPELVGTRGQCRQCQHIFTITTQSEERAAEKASTALVFSCPECQQLFEGKPEMEGRSGRCHVCQAVFPIRLRPAGSPAAASDQPASKTASQSATQSAPQPATRRPADGASGSNTAQAPAAKRSAAAAAATPKAAPKSTAMIPASSQQPTRRVVPKPKPTRPAQGAAAVKPIRFMCSHCQGTMEVPGESAGLDTACPYCQAVQTIPDASTASAGGYASPPAPTHDDPFASLSFPASGAASHANPAAALGLPLDPLGSVNPYAAAPQSTWHAPKRARSRRGLSLANIFQTTFENLFPSCLVTLLHAIVMTIGNVGLSIFLFAMMLLVKSLKMDPQMTMIAGIVVYIIMAPLGLSIAAWFLGSVQHMALRAVRGREFDFNKAFSPAGGFGAAMLVLLLQTFVQLLFYLPLLIEYLAPGTVGAFALVWALLIMVVLVVFMTGSSLTCFAGIDGESAGEALGTSFQLVFSNLPIMVATKLLVWIMTIILLLPTLGLSIVLPFYFNATLYHLASQE